MKSLGIITIAHWVSGEIEKGYTAYLEHKDRFARLKHVVSDGGYMRPLFYPDASILEHLSTEAGFFDDWEDITLSTLVFLSTDENLSGTYIDKVVTDKRFSGAVCWASKVVPTVGSFPGISAEGDLEFEKTLAGMKRDYLAGSMPGFWWDYLTGSL